MFKEPRPDITRLSALPSFLATDKECERAWYRKIRCRTAQEAYNRWCEKSTEENFREAFLTILPLIRICIYNIRAFVHGSPANFENGHDAISLIAEKIFRKQLPKKNCGPTLWGIIVRKIVLSSLSQTRSRCDRDWWLRHASDARPVHGRVTSHRDAEYRIFLSRLPRMIVRSVLDDLRFKGNMRKACLYVLECLLFEKKVIRFVLTERYAIRNPKFVVDYVQVLIRKAIYHVKDDLMGGMVFDQWSDAFQAIAPGRSVFVEDTDLGFSKYAD